VPTTRVLWNFLSTDSLSSKISLMSNPQLVEFQTSDKLNLPGLFYEPFRKTDKAALYLHGNGSSSVFYDVTIMNFLGSELNLHQIAFLPFNNRGANYITKLRVDDEHKKWIKIGTTYELIRDCIYDIDAAVSFLKSRNYREFYLIGHSTGANKICVYNYYKPQNSISKYILLGGGDDTGIYYKQLGPRKFRLALQKAKQEIQKGNGGKLVPKYLVDYLFSYQSLYDTLNPDGDYNIFPFLESLEKIKLSKKPLFREYKSITKPTLVIYGSDDEYCYGKVSEIIETLGKMSSVPGKFKLQIINDCDHGFDGKEGELVDIITRWLSA